MRQNTLRYSNRISQSKPGHRHIVKAIEALEARQLFSTLSVVATTPTAITNSSVNGEFTIFSDEPVTADTTVTLQLGPTKSGVATQFSPATHLPVGPKIAAFYGTAMGHSDFTTSPGYVDQTLSTSSSTSYIFEGGTTIVYHSGDGETGSRTTGGREVPITTKSITYAEQLTAIIPAGASSVTVEVIGVADANAAGPLTVIASVVSAPSGFDVSTTDGSATISIVQGVVTSSSPTATQLIGTTIGTAGSYQNKGNTIARATDGSLSTFFDGPTANGNWVGVDLGATGGIVTQVEFASRSGLGSRMNGGIFQASNSATFASGDVNLYTIPANANPSSVMLTTAALTNVNAYRYYRYLSPNGSYGDVSEIEFFGTTGGLKSYTRLNGSTIGTVGSYAGNGKTIAQATDGNLSTYFDGPNANGNWVGFDLGSSKSISQIAFAPRSGLASRMVGGLIQISTTADFSSGVTTIYTITTAPVSGVLTTVSLSSPVTARYVRYLSPNGGYSNISEFQVFG